MKATFTFEADTRDECMGVMQMMYAPTYVEALRDIDEKCRQRLKHGAGVSELERATLEELRAMVFEVLRDD